jgi:hypothetical protein
MRDQTGMGDRAMTDTTLSDLRVGQTVRAFHPRTLGVIYTGTVERVGTKWVHVHFPISGSVHKMAPRYVTEIVEG